MDEIEKRLSEACESCVSCYSEWRADPRDSKNREKFRDSIHELRKVASRLEIEMATSERDENAQKPIPIPAHRSKRDRGGKRNESPADMPDDDTMGNIPDDAMGARSGGRPRPQVRRSRRRSPSSSSDS